MAKSRKPAAKAEPVESEFGPVRIKVSEKGAISVYDIRRFPITFYADEWLWLFSKQAAIVDYIQRHSSELKEQEKARKAVTGTETV